MIPKVCAHRGASHHFAENSLNAFRKAVAFRADSIEIDIRATKDRQLVACHDFNLSRLTGHHLELSEINLEDFKKLKIYDQEPTTSINEILSEIDNPIQIVFDVKEKGLEKLILDTIQNFNLEERVIVSSFDPRVIANIKRLNPDIKTALIAGPLSIMPLAVNICFYLRRVTEYVKADYMHLCYLHYLHPGYQTLHKWGYKISYWTVDRPRDIRAVLRLDPQMIITNRPDIVRRLLKPLERKKN